MIVPDDKSLRELPARIGEGWLNTAMPDEGQLVEVLAEDANGHYRIPFPVRFRDDGWHNAHTGEELDTFIAAWRPHGGTR